MASASIVDQRHGRRARIITRAVAGVPPRIMGYGPVPAVNKALQRAGLNMEDIGVVEINEAFAVVTMAAIRELSLDHEKVNVHGGACALGHPIGASGARILVTLLSAMDQYDLKTGLASLCIGGGEATAIAVERIK